MDNKDHSKVESVVLTPRQTTFIILGLLLGILLEAIDSTFINNVLPVIVGKLGGTLQMQSWVISSYLLTMTMTTPIYGRLSDLYGRMPFYLGGMILFMLGSLLSGASQTMGQLIAFRALQGLGAGAMMPIAVAIGQTLFPAEKRGKFQAAISGAFALAAVFGPLLGGFIVKQLTWRWLFYLNLPFGILALVILYMFLPENVRSNKSYDPSKKIDYVGAVLLATFTASLMLFFTLGSDTGHGFLSFRSFVCAMIAAFSLLMFVLVERRAVDPIIPFSLFKNTTFLLSVSAVFLLGGIMFSATMYLPQYFQFVMVSSASTSGAFITPMMIFMVLGSLFSARSLGRTIYRYKWLATVASSLIFISLLMCIFLRSNTPLTFVFVATCLFGLGMGLTFPLYGFVVSNTIDKRMIGSAFGLLAFFRHIGGTIFTAIFGALYGNRLSGELKTELSTFLPRSAMDHFSIKQLVGKEAFNYITNTLVQLNLSRELTVKILSSLRMAVAKSIPVIFAATALVAFIQLIVNVCLEDKKIVFKTQKNSN